VFCYSLRQLWHPYSFSINKPSDPAHSRFVRGWPIQACIWLEWENSYEKILVVRGRSSIYPSQSLADAHSFAFFANEWAGDGSTAIYAYDGEGRRRVLIFRRSYGGEGSKTAKSG
jgi:hypothetical protein